MQKTCRQPIPAWSVMNFCAGMTDVRSKQVVTVFHLSSDSGSLLLTQHSWGEVMLNVLQAQADFLQKAVTISSANNIILGFENVSFYRWSKSVLNLFAQAWSALLLYDLLFQQGLAAMRNIQQAINHSPAHIRIDPLSLNSSHTDTKWGYTKWLASFLWPQTTLTVVCWQERGRTSDLIVTIVWGKH